MLASAISLLFGLGAFAALAVVQASLVAGARHARVILTALAELDRAETDSTPDSRPARVSRPEPVRQVRAFPPRYAAA